MYPTHCLVISGLQWTAVRYGSVVSHIVLGETAMSLPLPFHWSLDTAIWESKGISAFLTLLRDSKAPGRRALQPCILDKRGEVGPLKGEDQVAMGY